MPKFIAALRVKNEARWIGEVLESVKFADAIYLMDDHSTDETRQIAAGLGARVLNSPFEGIDEARDKAWLVNNIARDFEYGDWILMIDGDEVLRADGPALIKDTIARHAEYPAFTLKIIYLWDSRRTMRIDGVYGRFTRPSLFRLSRFQNFRITEVSGHLHCSSVPAAYVTHCGPCPAGLLHLGYMDRENRIRKWKFYNGIDPHNRVEGFDPLHPERGSYPHIVQGDIPEVPADIKLLHAGPLTLAEVL